MKEWWNNLSLRDKQMLSLGVAAIICFLIYGLLWAPLDNKVNRMRNQISTDQKLLIWMQETNQHIQESEKSLQKKGVTPSGVSILSIVQRQINKTPFVSSLSQLRQAENDAVQLTFNNVDFDKLIAWLTQLWQQQGLVITQISVIASTTPGLVSADLILKGS